MTTVREKLFVVLHVRRQPTEGRRPFLDVDAVGTGVKLRLQPRTQRVDQQPGETDLDAVLLLECRRDLLNHAPVARSVVTDEHKVWFSREISRMTAGFALGPEG